MNRHIRRATEKSDKKKEREKERRRQERRSARAERVSRRAEKPASRPGPDASPGAGPSDRQARVGRWSGLLTAAVVGLLLVKELSPAFASGDVQEMTGWTAYAFDASYFVFLGYFGCLWLLRRGTSRALPTVVGAGMVLAVLVEGVKPFLPRLEPDPLVVALALPALLLGALLGRWLYRTAGR